MIKHDHHLHHKYCNRHYHRHHHHNHHCYHNHHLQWRLHHKHIVTIIIIVINTIITIAFIIIIMVIISISIGFITIIFISSWSQVPQCLFWAWSQHVGAYCTKRTGWKWIILNFSYLLKVWTSWFYDEGRRWNWWIYFQLHGLECKHSGNNHHNHHHQL